MDRYFKPIMFLFVSAVVVCNIFLLKKSVKETVIPQNDPNELPDGYQSYFIDGLQNNGYELDDLYMQRLSDLSVIKAQQLFDKLDDSVLFICRTSVFHCESCVNYSIQKALELFQDYDGKMKLVLWGYYDNVNSLKIMTRAFSRLEPDDIYLVPDIILPLDARGYPFYFTLNKSMVVQDIFIPSTYSPEKTDVYWDYISDKWK